MSSFNKEQQLAIKLRDRNILVSAPAGSGKTRILVERMRRLIEEDDYEIDNLLVLTFTDAAGMEMKQRLNDCLRQDLEKPELSPTVKSHLQKQLVKLPQSNMGTFHSFCKSLLGKYGFTINVMPGFDILSTSRPLKEEAFERCLSEWIKDESFIDYANRYNTDNNFEALKKRLIGFMETSDSYVDFIDSLEKFKRDYYDYDSFNGSKIFDLMRETVKTTLNDAYQRYLNLVAFAEMHHIDIDQSSVNSKGKRTPSLREAYDQYFADQFTAFSRQMTYDTFIRQLNSEVEKSKNLSWKGVEEYKSEYQKIKNSILKGINILQQRFQIESEELKELLSLSYQDIAFLLGRKSLLSDLRSEYDHLKHERNMLDFSDLEKYTTALLEREDILQSLNHSFKEIMIDEYQDTNQIQENIVLKIAGQDDQHKDLKRVPMFMVGDMKQSIYRFRAADLDIFKQKFDSYPPYHEGDTNQNVRIDLKYNYRSNKYVLDSINYIFNALMDTEVGGLEYYRDPSALLHYDHNVKPAVEANIDHHYDTDILLGTFKDDDKKSDYRKEELEAGMVARKIKELTDTHQYEYKDIAILMHNANHFVTYKKVFEAIGIPANITEKKGLFKTNEIRSLISLLKALDDPYDDIAMASVLRNHFTFSCFDENELLSIRDPEGNASLFTNVQNSELPKAQAFNEVFSQLRKTALSSSPYETLIACLKESQFQSYVAALINGDQRLANIDTFLELARNSPYHYLDEFLDFLDADINQSPGKVASDGENAVQFMTIHSSKGLQFKVVFLAGLKNAFNTKDAQEPILIDRHYGIAAKLRMFAEDNLYGKILCELDHPYYYLIKSIINKKSTDEEMRILYVALTRAEEKLILTGIIDDKKDIVKYAYQTLTNEDVVYHHDARVEEKDYFSWIMLALIRHPQIQDTLKTYIPEISPYLHTNKKMMKKLKTAETECASFNLTIYTLDELEKNMTHHYQRNQNDKYQKYKQFYEFDYPYTDIPRSVAVTELQALEDEKRFTYLDGDHFSRDHALSLGTLVHNVLSYFSFDHSSLEELLSDLRHSAMFSEEEYELILAYKPHLADFIKSDIYQLISESETIYKEKPFRYKSGDQIINGIFDLVFIHQGKVYVLDYKTDHISNTLSLKRLQEKHRLQLTKYKEVLTAYFHQEVRGYVYYLETDQCVEI